MKPSKLLEIALGAVTSFGGFLEAGLHRHRGAAGRGFVFDI
jgi:hypothetical protein